MKKEITQFMKNKYRDYFMSDMYDLYDKYQKPSYLKHQAWKYCKDLCKEYNGHNLKVVGGNSMQFSAGFIGEVEGEPVYVHITKSYDRYIPLSEVR